MTDTSDLRHVYRLTQLGSGSCKFGDCEVCNEHFDTGYYLVQMRVYLNRFTGNEHLSYSGCFTLFGHKECLITQI